MTKKKITVDNHKELYDTVPYYSYSFPNTRPEHLNTLGLLFGMQPEPASLEKAKVLELGCSFGNNIINFAQNYPKSHVVGVDFSETEIGFGLETVKSLGLKNIELKHMSILDIDKSFGKFDYIICHGVLSWVPEDVQQKIFKVIGELLTPDGIAIVSYNTLPGWNMVRNIREIFSFHGQGFKAPQEKLEQGKLILDFINEALEKSNTPYANFLRNEAKNISRQEEYYLIHEHITPQNSQFYFHEIIDIAKENKLRYLAEAKVESMFLGNLPEKTAKKLAEVGDIVRTEQYMDFISNRRFRSTIFCREDAKINRNIAPDTLDKFYTTFYIQPEKPENEVDISDAKTKVNFYYKNSETPEFSTSSPVIKAILYTYAENIANPLTITEVIKKAHSKLPSYKIEDFVNEFKPQALRLVFSGHLRLFAEKSHSVFKISEKPLASKFARYQAENYEKKSWCTNQLNEVVHLKVQEKYILTLLDGKHTIAKLNEKMLAKLTSKEISVNNKDNKAIEDSAELKKIAEESVANALSKFKNSHLLIG